MSSKKEKIFFYGMLLLYFFGLMNVSFAKSIKNSLSETLGSPIVVDYWPLNKHTLKELQNSPSFVKVINLSFAVPDGKGGVKFMGENGIVDTERVKKIIHFFQKKNKKVLLSIGGEDVILWNLDTIDIALFCDEIKKIVDEYHLNGIDIDYELTQNRDKLPLFITTLRNLLPKDKYLITYAGFSIGAYGIEGHEHHEWDHYPTKGSDIAILKEIRNEVDWVSIMSYNAFFPTIQPPYRPEEALLAFQVLMGDKSKVLLGIMLGKQDSPKEFVVTSKQVRAWIEFVKKEKFRGLMFFQLSNDKYEITGEPTQTFTTLTKEILFNN